MFPVLGDVPIEQCFRTCNGHLLHNIYELKNFLEGCGDADFCYHVNSDHAKNDFAVWIRDVIKDEYLAEHLIGVLERRRYGEIIAKRLADLDEQYVAQLTKQTR